MREARACQVSMVELLEGEDAGVRICLLKGVPDVMKALSEVAWPRQLSMRVVRSLHFFDDIEGQEVARLVRQELHPIPNSKCLAGWMLRKTKNWVSSFLLTFHLFM